MCLRAGDQAGGIWEKQEAAFVGAILKEIFRGNSLSFTSEILPASAPCQNHYIHIISLSLLLVILSRIYQIWSFINRSFLSSDVLKVFLPLTQLRGSFLRQLKLLDFLIQPVTNSHYNLSLTAKRSLLVGSVYLSKKDFHLINFELLWDDSLNKNTKRTCTNNMTSQVCSWEACSESSDEPPPAGPITTVKDAKGTALQKQGEFHVSWFRWTIKTYKTC